MEECEFCKSKINDEKSNFCSLCGEALNLPAKKIEEKKLNNAKIEILSSISKEINDLQSIKVLNKHIELLSRKK